MAVQTPSRSFAWAGKSSTWQASFRPSIIRMRSRSATMVIPSMLSTARAQPDRTQATSRRDRSRKTRAINGSSPTGGSRGTDYEYEGTNREINIGLATLAQRLAADLATPLDPDILAGTGNVAAPDGPGTSAPQGGYTWDAVLRAGLSVRDYGMFCDLTRYSAPANTPLTIPEDRYPYQTGTQVAYVAEPELQTRFDPYFRGFDNGFPDYYREVEWEREFDTYDQNGQLPNLELVRIMHDHTGNFSTAIDGVNTIELQQADDDYALGRLIERVAHSRYKYNTLVFVLEDDAQDGADHVDAHRSIAFVAGPYVKHGAVVSNRYTTVNVLRTIEDILGTDHLDIHTATQQPMLAVFDFNQPEWDYKAVASAYLANTQLPIAASAYAAHKSIPRPTHDAAYWAEKTKEFDFSIEDHLGDVAKFNRIVWEGLKGAVPYPVRRTGANLRRNRKLLLRNAKLVESGTAENSARQATSGIP